MNPNLPRSVLVSYILEALKKAEAQRGQGQVPGIHDQHMLPEFGGAEREGQSLLIWIIMGMGLLMMGLLVWVMVRPDAPDAPNAPAAQAVRSATLPLATQTPSAENASASAQTDADVMAKPTKAVKVKDRASEKITPKADAVSNKLPVEPLLELPEAMRAELPRLNFGGAMHSDTPAMRMLIVNGQLLHEGDAVSPDLTLEEINLKQATLRYKGYRYTAKY